MRTGDVMTSTEPYQLFMLELLFTFQDDLMNKMPALLAVALIAGCTATPSRHPPLRRRMELPGRRSTSASTSDGPWVTPLAVLEDSRCPMNARVRVGRADPAVGADRPRRAQRDREIGSDQPIQVADGQLSLVEVQPDLMAGQAGRPGRLSIWLPLRRRTSRRPTRGRSRRSPGRACRRIPHRSPRRAGRRAARG